MPKWTDVLISLCLGLLVVGGLYFLYLGLRNVWQAVASRGWPAVEGVVRESRVEQRDSRDSKTGTVSRIHAARLRIEYKVGGRQYETGRVFIGQTEGSGDSSEAELLRMRYPEGARVVVYHDPERPEVGALKRGIHAGALWLPGAGLGFILPGVMFLIVYFSAERGMGGMEWGVTIFGGIFMMAGAAMLAAGGRNMWLGHVSRSWPVAEGEIVYSVGDQSASVSGDREGNRTRSTTYSTRLVYRYEAGGVERYGNVRRFGQLSGAEREWAAEIAEKYPKGARARVAYDPGDADHSVLEPGISPDAYWIPGIGLVAMMFGLAAALILAPVMRQG
jgi:hypothetical protein